MEIRWMIVMLFEIISLTTISSKLKSEAISSIQSTDGDIIDCIDIYKQPAFDHPFLRYHKIQMNPSNAVEKYNRTTTKDNEIFVGRNRDSPITVTSQLWQRSGTCPKGTISIRRRQHNNITKEVKINSYGRKKPMVDEKFVENVMLYQKNHSLAIIHTEGFAYYGVKGDIKVCNPNVEDDNEYTTSRVALRNGPCNNYQAIESGWAVNPGVYGDRQTRLFVSWTADGAKETGCFDLTCPGFVQTNNEIALGAAIYPISNPLELPYQITIYIHKDPITKNWWIQYGESMYIGYWPHELFDTLEYHFETVQWGGEVYSSRVGGVHPHTGTGMGCGIMSNIGFGCYVKRMRVLGNNFVLRIPEWGYVYTDEYECYDVTYLHDYIVEPELYYGGPGRSAWCP